MTENRLYIDELSKLNFSEKVSGATKSSWGVDSVSLGILNHIVLIIDGTQVIFYVNGVKQITPSRGAMTWGTKLDLGRTAQWGYCLNGIMHVARLYGKALSDSEIQTNRVVGVKVGL